MKNPEIYEKAIKQYLIDRYTTIQEDWNILIDMLAANIVRYKECEELINQHGIFNAELYKKNPLIATQKDIMATMIKLCQYLGIGPYAASKLKNLDKSSEDVLKNLLTMEDLD